jgi:hypothetical protein
LELHFPSRRSAQVARRSFNGHTRGRVPHARGSYNNRVRIDGRSAIARDIRRRLEGYAKQLGKAASEPSVKARLLELCEIETLTAQLRRDSLNGRDIDLLAVSRFVGLAKRLRESLRLDSPPPKPALPSLQELIGND